MKWHAEIILEEEDRHKRLGKGVRIQTPGREPVTVAGVDAACSESCVLRAVCLYRFRELVLVDK